MSLPTRERGLKLSFPCGEIKRFLVAPYAGAWVEIPISSAIFSTNSVAPYAGAWVEMFVSKNLISKVSVAPYAGAWVEILLTSKPLYCLAVAPYAGAWVEIFPSTSSVSSTLSLPTRERGLKLKRFTTVCLVMGRSLRGSVG